MAAGTRMNNTFAELLPKMLQLLTQMKQTEDADYEWIIQQETQVLEKIKQPFQQAAQMTAGPQPGSEMGMGAPVDPMQAMMAGMGSGGAEQMSRAPIQGNPNTAPAVDEIRRMMQGG